MCNIQIVPPGNMTGVALVTRGELLAVPDSGLFMLSGVEGGRDLTRVVFTEWSGIRRADFDQIGVSIVDGQRPERDDIRTLTALSRFPQGISAEIVADLLDIYDLTEVYVHGAQTGDTGTR